MRPTGCFALTLGKWLAAASMATLVLVAGALLLHVASYATDPSAMIDELPSTLRIMGALALLAFCCSAIWVPDIETWICGTVIGLVTALFLGLATVVVEAGELGYGRA